MKVPSTRAITEVLIEVTYKIYETNTIKGFSISQVLEYDNPITLKEIEDRVKADPEYEGGVIRVIAENGLNGIIYQYGNYSDKSWYEHGQTRGYA